MRTARACRLGSWNGTKLFPLCSSTRATAWNGSPKTSTTSHAEEGRIPLDLSAHRVGDLIWAATDAARATYQLKGVNLVVDTDRTAGIVVNVDPQRFGQITANLLDNARRHTPAGGSVSVGGLPLDAEVAIRFTDTGDGIPPGQVPHVFERFYRGDTARDRAHGGSGIGLTISKALADALGGSLTATSPGAGKGSTFTVTLPASPAGRSTRQPTTPAVPGAGRIMPRRPAPPLPGRRRCLNPRGSRGQREPRPLLVHDRLHPRDARLRLAPGTWRP